MPSKLTLRMLLAAATLGALQLSASGAPLEDARADDPAGEETSGEAEEEEPLYQRGSLDVLKIWDQVIRLTDHHQEEFEEEFQGNVEYILLDDYKHPKFPNSSKEACLQRLVEGLLTYMVLLKHVEKEYPNCPMVTEVKATVPLLITSIKQKMKKSEEVKALTSNQEQQLLKELNSPDSFTRKMTAHSILSSFRPFLVDGIRSFRKLETAPKQAACSNNKLVQSCEKR